MHSILKSNAEVGTGNLHDLNSVYYILEFSLTHSSVHKLVQTFLLLFIFSSDVSKETHISVFFLSDVSEETNVSACDILPW